MNRRDFARTLAGAATGTVFLPRDSVAQTALPFRLSVMLWTVFRELPFDQRLEKIAEAGYKSVELVGEFSNWSNDDFTRFNAKKHALGITFDATAGVRTGVADPSAGDKLLDDIKTMLVTVDRLECPNIILLSGNKIPGVSPDMQHAASINNLGRAAELAAKQNVSLLLENIDPEENPKYYLTSVAEGFDIIRKVGNPNVKFLYDFYHEQIAEGNLIEKLQKNIDLLGVVHVADVPGRHDPGTGEINYSNIYRQLVELNFTGTVAMEFLPASEPVAALRTAREMVLQAAGRKQ